MALRLWCSSYLLLLLSILAASTTADAEGNSMYCSDNSSTITDAYAANLKQLLTLMSIKTVENGGFFNDTVGQGADTVYGLAMCYADYSTKDCKTCLEDASDPRAWCPGSSTAVVSVWCLVHFSERNFFGTAESDLLYIYNTTSVLTKAVQDNLNQVLANVTAQAAVSPQRFAATTESFPHALAQCTWDVPSDKCKACFDAILLMLPGNTTEGDLRSPSCRLKFTPSRLTLVPPGSPTPRTAGAPSSATSPPEHTAARSNSGVVIGSVTGAVVTVTVIVGLVVACRCRENKGFSRYGRVKSERPITSSVLQPTTEVHFPREFTLAELVQATRNFTDKLGSGAFGEVFQGKLNESGTLVAVKNIIEVTEQAKQEYISEIRTISRLRHRNLVLLMGWCSEGDKLLLVYELMTKGSLCSHLHRPTTQLGHPRWQPLEWEQRYRIITDIASGLEYLHNGSDQGIIHRDIKPANVLLDEFFTAKLADFGLARSVNHDGTSHMMTVKGSVSYMDPDYRQTKMASKESDVYSFGVVLLEILCGIKPEPLGIENTLVNKVRELYDKDRILDAADKALIKYVDKELLKRTLWIGLLCVHPKHNNRPTSWRVNNYLTDMEAEVPRPRRCVTVPDVRPGEVHGPREFTFAELQKATDNFSDKLGGGTFGEVFKGKLEGLDGFVAVKRIKEVDDKARIEFLREIETIRKLSHQNLVALQGWCNEAGQLLLVYEFMEKGSLTGHLHCPTTATARQNWIPLDWDKRYKILVGIATALDYLHDGSAQAIIHRDIKPDNVLLDRSSVAKLCDFGLVRKVDHDASAQEMTVSGTYCYLDPEYWETGRASKECDVYSFGVVLLEILCGEKPKLQGRTNTLIKKVHELHAQNRIIQAVDNALTRNNNIDPNQLKRILWIGLLCVQPNHKDRPNSTQVKAYLKKDDHIPEPRVVPGFQISSTIHRQGSGSYRTAPPLPLDMIQQD